MGIGQIRTGKAAIEGTKRGKRSTSFISWKKDETKSVFFLTPINEVARILAHNYVRKVVETDDGETKDIWLTFMCRKDPSWLEESQGYCPLCDDIGHQAKERIVAFGVEVDPILEGKRFTGVQVKTREGTDKEGNTVTYPEIGVLMQASGNFFQYLLTQSERREISGTTWEITREGDDLQTKYNFYPVEFAPDLDPYINFLPDLYEYLNELGSQERYDREMEGITAENQQNTGTRRTGRPARPAAKSPSSSEETKNLFQEMKDAIEENQKKKSKVEGY